MVILRKGGSAKASSQYFTLFCIFLHSERLVIYTFMGHILISIDILYAYISLNLLAYYVIACCIRLDI